MKLGTGLEGQTSVLSSHNPNPNGQAHTRLIQNLNLTSASDAGTGAGNMWWRWVEGLGSWGVGSLELKLELVTFCFELIDQVLFAECVLADWVTYWVAFMQLLAVG